MSILEFQVKNYKVYYEWQTIEVLFSEIAKEKYFKAVSTIHGSKIKVSPDKLKLKDKESDFVADAFANFKKNI